MELTTLAYHDSKWQGEFPPLDSKQTLVIVFGAPEFRDQPEPVEAIARAYPNSVVIGCSTSGEIFGEEIRDNSLSAAIVKFEHARLEYAESHVQSSGDSFFAGQDIATRLFKPDLRAILVLSEGIHINGSELVRGMNSIVPESVVVTGGLAGDGDRFQRTWVLRKGCVEENGIVAVGIYGQRVHIGHGSKGGWEQAGTEHKITRSAGNVLYELDGKPALKVYEEHLGDKAAGLPATGLLFPLSLRITPDSPKTIVRTILGIDRDKQSLTFAGDIPNGYVAQFMQADFDRLVGGAADAARMMQSGTGASDAQSPTLMVAISCVGRRLVLGERTKDELEATHAIGGDNSRQIGFYSYGEISPYASGHCDLHNQTMTLTSISES
jgi:hypothetical protein